MNPFGIGSRNCPGRSMALLNINPVIARANRLYGVHQADGDLARVGEGSPRAPKGKQRVNNVSHG